jgi:PAS domain S-box-containing protein
METALFGGVSETRPTIRFEVDSAYQGKEGYERVIRARSEGRPYAMAFMDVRMPPGWDGIETAEKIWEVDPDMQIVICTAYSDYSWENLSRRFGQSDKLVILKKPFDNIETLQLATALTEKWSLARQARSQLENLEKLVEGRTQELRAAKDVAERERGRYLALFSQAPDGLLGFGADQLILEANEAACRLLGQARQEILGRALDVVLSRAGAGPDIDLNGTPNGQSLLELRVSRGADGIRFLEVSVQPAAGPEVSRLLVLRDVTQRKLIENRIGHAQRLEAVGQLAGGIAHDFNNLLTAIGASAELLLSSPDLETQSLAQIVLDAQKRGSGLTRQLLAFARRDVHQPTVIDLVGTVAGMADLADRVLGKQHQLHLVHSEPLYIEADAAQLEQVILNLVTNARDAMPLGGTIQFAMKSLSDAEAQRMGSRLVSKMQALIEVVDTGVGIPPELHSRIFEPFFTTKARGRGTGLGLAAVQGIVIQNHGSIALESVVGQGTAFRIFFPLQEVAPKVPLSTLTAPRSTDRPTDGYGLRLLLVDDEELVRKATASILSSEGYDVRTASSGDQALGLLNSAGPFDIVLTDLAMPGMNGLELGERIRFSHPRLPVVYMSGFFEDTFSGRSGIVASAKSGHFLAKPFSREQLFHALHLAVGAGKTAVLRNH